MKMYFARNRKGGLNLFTDQPIKDRHGRWFGKGQTACNFDNPEVTFENSPMEVELKLVNDV